MICYKCGNSFEQRAIGKCSDCEQYFCISKCYTNHVRACREKSESESESKSQSSQSSGKKRKRSLSDVAENGHRQAKFSEKFMGTISTIQSCARNENEEPVDINLSICTWNLEKFAKSTEFINEKINLMRDFLLIHRPNVLVLMEVTDPILFELFVEQFVKLGYQYMAGPYFEAETYKESYPIFFDSSVIVGVPELFTVRQDFYHDTSKIVTLDAYDDQTYKFGRALKEYRPLVVWEFTVKAKTRITRQVSGKVGKIQIGVVHTSPSFSKIQLPVHVQVAAHIKAAKNIHEAFKLPMILAGDWYANKNKTLWKSVNEDKDLIIDAPEKRTNFKENSEGQIADHFFSTNECTLIDLKTISPKQPYALEKHKEEKNTEEKLSEWLDIDVDHCPVYAMYRVAVNPSEEIVINNNNNNNTTTTTTTTKY
jgi:hypothetical protein